MKQQLPPRVLVKTWLEIMSDDEIPLLTRQQRTKVIIEYFNSVESAYIYVQHNQPAFRRAS